MEIPLIGLNYFGIVDRNTSLIEVKPSTICNFNCIYCSIDAGLSSKKPVEFVIEKDFLIEELEKLVNSGSHAVAFSMFETTIKQLMDIADADEIMPPKSTWFEPKLRDGLVCHNFLRNQEYKKIAQK